MITLEPSSHRNLLAAASGPALPAASPEEPEYRLVAESSSPGSDGAADIRSLPFIRPLDANRWGSLPTAAAISGTPADLVPQIPVFEKLDPRMLGLAGDDYADLIVRTASGDAPAVVGLVSKSYQLIQHRTVFEHTLDAARKVSGAELGRVDIQMTANGARAMTRVDLGTRFEVGPDSHPVRLHLVSFNSVDGGAALLVRLGWYRLICSNGLAVGLTVSKTRLAHTPGASVEDVFSALNDQLEVASRDRETMMAWAKVKVGSDRLRAWVDGPVLGKWNTLSAARIWHICTSGHDAGFVPPFEKRSPSQRNVRLLGRVPGAAVPATTLYAVAQALSWVASRRSDLEEARATQGQIAELMEALKN